VGQPSLSAGARWAMAGGIGAFALSLAAIHLGAEWTSLRDRTFLGRMCLAAFAFAVAAAGDTLVPLVFVGLLSADLLAQLLLEAFTPRAGAATVVELIDHSARSRSGESEIRTSSTKAPGAAAH